MLLYLAHVSAAVAVGVILRGRGRSNTAQISAPQNIGFASALSEAVVSAVQGILSVCGFVVFFSAALGILRESGIFGTAALFLSSRTALTLHQTTAALIGFLELGGGITALRGEALSRAAMSLCAAMLGWGGISVHMQTASALSGTDIRLGQHTAARALHGGISAAIAAAVYPLIF
jgi:hypothetical protein